MRKLEIEPLEKARWDRIERELRERLEDEPASGRQIARPARPLVGLVLAGAAAAVIGAVAWNALRATSAPSSHAPELARVETEDAPSRVEFGGATLDVAAHSAARMEGSYESGVTVSLDHGSVECDVAPRHDRPPFVVRAGDVDVRVVGTHFRVDREGGATRVSVQRGVVEVESHGITTRVPAGSGWPETAAIAPPSPPSSVAAAPSEPLRPAPKRETAPAPTAPSEAAPSPRERYGRALTLEESRPDEALAILRELAAGDGSWAMNALYEEARLDLERGDKDSAKKLFAEYLRRYPTGPNANDAKEQSAKLP